MRLRFIFLPMVVVFSTWSCQTTNDAANTPPVEMDATAPPAEQTAATPEKSTAEKATIEATAPVAQGGQDLLSQDAERLQRIRERQTALSAQYLAAGDRLLDLADLNGALEQYSQALDVMPSSEAARDKIRKVQVLMGANFAEAAQGMHDLEAQEVVRRAQARMAAEDAVIQGKTALGKADYDHAIEHFREAQTILRYHPLIADDSLSEKAVTGMLEDAVTQGAEAKKAQAERLRAEAEAEKSRKEKEQREYRENQIKTVYNKANQAFLADNYAQAELLCNQILGMDPGNQAAMELRDVAQTAKHQKADETTRIRYREEWRKTMDELQTMDVPQIDPLVFDDLARWAEVSKRRPLEFGTRDTRSAQDKQAVLDRLEQVRIAPHFVGTDDAGSPLSEIANHLQNLSGVNFLISPGVAALDEEAQTIKLDLPERSVKTVLDIIADTNESIRWKIEDGVVKFVTKEEMLGGQVLKTYGVQDLIHPVPNFAGREINVNPSEAIEQPEDTTPVREGLVVTSDALEALIRDNIAPASWSEDPKNSVRITEAGAMVVNQTPEVQEQIQKLLDDLREATSIMVDIQARFLKVEDNFLEDIGVDFRGLGQPGKGTNRFFNDFGDASTQGDIGNEIGQDTDLGAFYDDGQDGDYRARVEHLYDAALGDTNVLTNAGGLSFSWTYLNDLQAELILRAVSKSERVELVTSPRLLVFNTARANLAVLNQVAYVKDFNVEIAQAASIADPIVDVIQDGVVLDVRPVVSADRRFIMMELRPTVAVLQRPIEEVNTSLGSQNAVSIQLPQVDIQKVRTTVPMPDGGTVMLGGLKVSEKKDMTSGVPILSKIPLVRFLFERKGTYN
jgi:type II secretory pathway component GspD/PulD (secretin)